MKHPGNRFIHPVFWPIYQIVFTCRSVLVLCDVPRNVISEREIYDYHGSHHE